MYKPVNVRSNFPNNWKFSILDPISVRYIEQVHFKVERLWYICESFELLATFVQYHILKVENVSELLLKFSETRIYYKITNSTM